jgi:hypothetical protein
MFFYISMNRCMGLKRDGCEVDPLLMKFTGISVPKSQDVSQQIACSMKKPKSINTVRRWDEVVAYNPNLPALFSRHTLPSRM